jgi:molybdopterin-containing oxidoreductase family iron-sulfur binding subunit
MAKLSIVIDLDLCIGCNACTLACKAEHGTQPGVFWGKVLEHETGRTPAVTRLFLPVLCNHCEDPPCREVCPTRATTVDDDGVVLVDYEKCIGCRACVAACPYMSRTYLDRERYYFPDTPIPRSARQLQGVEGVVQKCNLCVERRRRGEPPACVEVCPTSCRVFGDLEDPGSSVSELVRSERSFQLLPEKGTAPKVHYLLTNKAVLAQEGAGRR